MSSDIQIQRVVYADIGVLVLKKKSMYNAAMTNDEHTSTTTWL